MTAGMHRQTAVANELYRQNILYFGEAPHADRVTGIEEEASAVPTLDVLHPVILRMVPDDAHAKVPRLT